MTINTKTKNPALCEETTDKRTKTVWDTDTGEHWPSAMICAAELDVPVERVYAACGGYTKTCNGRHLSYEENVTQTRSNMAGSLVRINAEKDALRSENESLRAELERYREAERISNQQQTEDNERKSEIERLTKLRGRHKRAYDRYMAHAHTSMEHIEEIDRKLEELKNGRK